MHSNHSKFFLVALALVLVIPAATLAAFWNPFRWNWNILNWFNSHKAVQVQQLQSVSKRGVNPQENSQIHQNKDSVHDSKGERANWKSYVNTEYGFAIDYPLYFRETTLGNAAGNFSLYLGYNNTAYLGEISIHVYRNDKNQTLTQYFAEKKTKDSAAYASHCQTCGIADIDAEFDECMITNGGTIAVGKEAGFVCNNMPQRATWHSPVFIFHNEYIYEFDGFNENSSNQGEYKLILSTFKFIS